MKGNNILILISFTPFVLGSILYTIDSTIVNINWDVFQIINAQIPRDLVGMFFALLWLVVGYTSFKINDSSVFKSVIYLNLSSLILFPFAIFNELLGLEYDILKSYLYLPLLSFSDDSYNNVMSIIIENPKVLDIFTLFLGQTLLLIYTLGGIIEYKRKNYR